MPLQLDTMTPEGLKRLVKHLRKAHANVLGAPLAQHLAQEMLAQTFGYATWHEVKATRPSGSRTPPSPSPLPSAASTASRLSVAEEEQLTLAHPWEKSIWSDEEAQRLMRHVKILAQMGQTPMLSAIVDRLPGRWEPIQASSLMFNVNEAITEGALENPLGTTMTWWAPRMSDGAWTAEIEGGLGSMPIPLLVAMFKAKPLQAWLWLPDILQKRVELVTALADLYKPVHPHDPRWSWADVGLLSPDQRAELLAQQDWAFKTADLEDIERWLYPEVKQSMQAETAWRAAFREALPSALDIRELEKMIYAQPAWAADFLPGILRDRPALIVALVEAQTHPEHLAEVQDRLGEDGFAYLQQAYEDGRLPGFPSGMPTLYRTPPGLGSKADQPIRKSRDDLGAPTDRGTNHVGRLPRARAR